MDLLSLDDDALMAIMQFVPVKTVRGTLLVVNRRLSGLASSAAALGGHVAAAGGHGAEGGRAEGWRGWGPPSVGFCSRFRWGGLDKETRAVE